MTRSLKLSAGVFACMLLLPAGRVSAQEVPARYKDVLTFLGRQGDFKADVLKVNIPRNDLKITVAGIATPTPFGSGGWIAMTKGTGMDVMMGDLVLTKEEVNPVMSALLENGLEVTALHNHFFWDEPRVFYMHVHGHGTPTDLAHRVKPALDLIGKITVGRDDLKLREMGAPISARMGLNTWAAFVGTNDKAAIAGDVAMLASEVTPVLKALRQHGLDVVAIHHHMTGTKLAAGFKAGLDQL